MRIGSRVAEELVVEAKSFTFLRHSVLFRPQKNKNLTKKTMKNRSFESFQPQFDQSLPSQAHAVVLISPGMTRGAQLNY